MKPARSVKKSARTKPVKSAKKVAVPVKEVPARSNEPAQRDILGFLAGSDLDRTYKVMATGGTDRADIHDKLVVEFKDEPTASGRSKPVSTLMHQVLKRADELGGTVEGTWRLVVPEDADFTKLKTAPRMSSRKPVSVTEELDQELAKKPKKSAKKSAKKAVKRPATFKGLTDLLP